jgi:hypothetical protein
MKASLGLWETGFDRRLEVVEPALSPLGHGGQEDGGAPRAARDGDIDVATLAAIEGGGLT